MKVWIIYWPGSTVNGRTAKCVRVWRSTLCGKFDDTSLKLFSVWARNPHCPPPSKAGNEDIAGQARGDFVTP